MSAAIQAIQLTITALSVAERRAEEVDYSDAIRGALEAARGQLWLALRAAQDADTPGLVKTTPAKTTLQREENA